MNANNLHSNGALYSNRFYTHNLPNELSISAGRSSASIITIDTLVRCSSGFVCQRWLKIKSRILEEEGSKKSAAPLIMQIFIKVNTRLSAEGYATPAAQL